MRLNVYGLPVLQATSSTHYLTVLQNALDYEIAVLQNWIMRLPVFGLNWIMGLQFYGI